MSGRPWPAAMAADRDGREGVRHVLTVLGTRPEVIIVSDSGGVQEEAPTLGKPLLILRDSTERPETVEAGVGLLVGHRAGRLLALLEGAARNAGWVEVAACARNPFGQGDSGRRIVDILADVLQIPGGIGTNTRAADRPTGVLT